jgi:hypothetical protein
MRGDAQELGEGPVEGDAERLVVGAEIVLAAQTLAATPATDVGRDEDALAEAEPPLHAGADIRDRADDLVARHPHRAGAELAMDAPQDAQVGRADARVVHPQHDLSGACGGRRTLLDAQVLRPMIYRCEHCLTPARRRPAG